MTRYPTAQEIDELPAVAEYEIPQEFQDGNGHVNVRHHYNLHMQGSEAGFEALKFDDDYRQATGHSIFSVEHHVFFHSEVLVAAKVSIHLRLLGRSEKILHAQSILFNRTTQKVASTAEYIEAHVDLTTRRATPFGPSAARVLDEVIAAHQQLGWRLPLAQPMAPRR